MAQWLRMLTAQSLRIRIRITALKKQAAYPTNAYNSSSGEFGTLYWLLYIHRLEHVHTYSYILIRVCACTHTETYIHK